MPRCTTGWLLGGLAELRQHRDAARGDVLGRRIEQRAVIGERDVVEVVYSLSASNAPQPPFWLCRPTIHSAARAIGPEVARRSTCAIHRHHHHGGVVEIGIMRIGILERPAARPHVRALAAQSPSTSSICCGASQSRPCRPAPASALAADLEQRMAGQRRVPHRRHAGLAIGLVLLTTRSFSIDLPRDRALGMVRPDSRARRTSSRCWPSPGRSRRGRPRR